MTLALALFATPLLFAPKGFPAVHEGGALVAPHVQDDFLYAGYYQQVGANTQGAGAMMLQGDPSVAHEDAHSLGEIGLSTADNQQIVEIGWHVDPLVNDGDRNPRLFVFHWVDGQPTCYNECGWVQTSANYHPGMKVTPGEVAEYRIEHKADGWHISYKGEEMGYFPASLWNAARQYTAVDHAQWFGEVSAENPVSCSEMGTGQFGTSAGSTTMSGLYLISTSGANVAANAVQGTVTNASYYNVGDKTPTSFAFGGPGAPNTTCCTPQSCSDFAQGVPACGTIPDRCNDSIMCGVSCDNGNPCVGHLCGVQPPDDGGMPDHDADPGGDGGHPDGGNNDNGDEDGGCCDAGSRSAIGVWPALLVGGALLRRRRRMA
ncbi:MAG TPA: neprosin family prolyl endopeptidase [Kofleriaceae bacterium]|jgi:uncharacterized protein (TIGR03382 family)